MRQKSSWGILKYILRAALYPLIGLPSQTCTVHGCGGEVEEKLSAQIALWFGFTKHVRDRRKNV